MTKREQEKRNYETFREPRTRTIKELNNVYVLANLTSKLLSERQKRIAVGEADQLEFEAPSASGETTIVTRDVKQLTNLLKNARTRGIYEQSLVTAVALVEDYVQGTLRVILRWFVHKRVVGCWTSNPT